MNDWMWVGSLGSKYGYSDSKRHSDNKLMVDMCACSWLVMEAERAVDGWRRGCHSRISREMHEVSAWIVSG